MSDEPESTNENEDVDTPTQEELDARMDAGPSRMDALKEKARVLGISHSPNIGEDTLAQKIQDHVEALEASSNKSKEPEPVSDPKPEAVAKTAPVMAADAKTKVPRSSEIPKIDKLLKMTTEDLLAQPERLRTPMIRARQRHEGMRLLRCQIYCNNPAKNDLKGEILSVANKYIGVVKKFVPFGEATENGYHLPKVLVDMLKRRKYQQVRTVKNQDGTERVVTTLVPEFTINIMEPLTREELSKLATRQQAVASVGFMGA